MNDVPFGPMFERLDELAPSLGEEVVMQVGNTGFTGRNTRCFPFKREEEMTAEFDKASLVICHAGIGTILNGLERNLPLVLVPREVVLPNSESEQQGVVAKKVEEMGRATVVWDLDELEAKIKEARELKFPPYSKDNSLCVFLSGLLDDIEAKRERPRGLFGKRR